MTKVLTAAAAARSAVPASGDDPGRRFRAARVWNLLLVANVALALVIQLALILTGGPDPNTGETVATVGIATRMVQTLSFFTIQSNILVLIVAVTLAINPARDGRIWRILRFDALLGITITGLVFELILMRYVHPSGWQLVATVGLHYVAPWATVLGWLLFGPRPRIDRSTLAWASVWPVAWIACTFVRGALVHWYPYPFLDVDKVGYGPALLSVLAVLVVATVLAAIFARLDRRGAAPELPTTPDRRGAGRSPSRRRGSA
ncbi:MAG: Pr6Pr family membrane protein [Cellulomonas sp.]